MWKIMQKIKEAGGQYILPELENRASPKKDAILSARDAVIDPQEGYTIDAIEEKLGNSVSRRYITKVMKKLGDSHKVTSKLVNPNDPKTNAKRLAAIDANIQNLEETCKISEKKKTSYNKGKFVACVVLLIEKIKKDLKITDNRKLPPIHLAADGSRCHSSEDMDLITKEYPTFKFIRTPPYTPDMNLCEFRFSSYKSTFRRTIPKTTENMTPTRMVQIISGIVEGDTFEPDLTVMYMTKLAKAIKFFKGDVISARRLVSLTSHSGKRASYSTCVAQKSTAVNDLHQEVAKSASRLTRKALAAMGVVIEDTVFKNSKQ